MQINGEQLFFLLQILKDSLDIQMGYDWNFKYKKEKRKNFYEELLRSILSQENFHIQEFDKYKFKN